MSEKGGTHSERHPSNSRSLATSYQKLTKWRRKTIMKRSLLFVVSGLIILSMLLAACGPQATPVSPAETEAPPTETAAPPPAEPIKIGSSLPITGGFAINGQKHRDGYQLCVDLINEKGGLLGRQVEFIVNNNQS